MSANSAAVRGTKTDLVLGLVDSTSGSWTAKLAENDYGGLTVLVNCLMDDGLSNLHSGILRTLINGAATSEEVKRRILGDDRLMRRTVSGAFDVQCKLRLSYATLACNLSRTTEEGARVLQYVHSVDGTVQLMLHSIVGSENCRSTVNPLALLLLNFTQFASIRQALIQSLNDMSTLLQCMQMGHRWQKLCIANVIRNLCMDPDQHGSIVARKELLLTTLLYPLLGSGECKPCEIEDIWPDWLSLMTKEREDALDIRLAVLQAVYQLCNSRVGREALRSMGTYYVLREYHKWETEDDAWEMCDLIIGLLIRTEDEIGCDVLTKWSFEQDEVSKNDNRIQDGLKM